MTLFDEPLLGSAEDPEVVLADRSTDPAVLLARAGFLREVADEVEPLVATSIRRRASELELTAWVLRLRSAG